jgi:hypothetical protein
MTPAYLALAALVAVAAAVRSTWSPCGLSMLSAMTPLAEQGRGHRFGATAAWFLAGAVAGGATLGAGAGALAALVGLADLPVEAAAAIAVLLALVCAASDARLGGFALPRHDRRWVYASGFGWQIGVGLATFIVTSAVYLTIGVAALTGDPITAFVLCVAFGIVRGLMIFLGRPHVTFEKVQALHRRVHAWADTSWRLTLAAQIAAAGAFALVAGAPWPAVALAAIAGVAVVAQPRWVSSQANVRDHASAAAVGS